MRRTEDYDFAIDRSSLTIVSFGEGPGQFGFVTTPAGIVGVYADSEVVVLYFCVDGREYRRTYRGALTERGIATVAGRFARELTA